MWIHRSMMCTAFRTLAWQKSYTDIQKICVSIVERAMHTSHRKLQHVVIWIVERGYHVENLFTGDLILSIGD